MKFRSQIIATSLITALLPAVTSADTDTDRSSPRAFVKDSVITTKIKAKLAAEKLSNLFKIQVDTDDHGIVQLSGTAKDQAEIDRAVAIASAVEGVVRVNNLIQIGH